MWCTFRWIVISILYSQPQVVSGSPCVISLSASHPQTASACQVPCKGSITSIKVHRHWTFKGLSVPSPSMKRPLMLTQVALSLPGHSHLQVLTTGKTQRVSHQWRGRWGWKTCWCVCVGSLKLRIIRQTKVHSKLPCVPVASWRWQLYVDLQPLKV